MLPDSLHGLLQLCMLLGSLHGLIYLSMLLGYLHGWLQLCMLLGSLHSLILPLHAARLSAWLVAALYAAPVLCMS
jgi:hypothetical protein